MRCFVCLKNFDYCDKHVLDLDEFADHINQYFNKDKEP